jgi:hypothetical protein
MPDNSKKQLLINDPNVILNIRIIENYCSVPLANFKRGLKTIALKIA